MRTFLNIFDLNRKKTALLQNAFDITETQELNKIYTMEFKIPLSDEKAQFIQPFHYARYGETGELYRIISVKQNDNATGTLVVNCEHVIATLTDDLMFGAVQYGGGSIKTSAVITYLLNQQKTHHWILSECDFNHKFEYLWEQENLLNALYSIPKEFTKSYKWSFNTITYPWRLSLKAIDGTISPEYYIRAKRNLLSSGTAQDYTGICTRIYPLGYGEGVNQLTIEDVNNGVPYLQSPANIIAQYGIKEKVLVDRRYENAESLKEYAQTMLDSLQTPSMSRDFDVVDLYPLTSQSIDNAEVGKICKMTMDDTIAYITKTVRVLDEPGNLQIEISTKSTDVASSIADLADRVRIESVYAQGATQLYQHSKDANATTAKGSVLNLYFPEEMRQINKVLLKVQLEKFRSYSQATNSKEVTVKTNEAALTNLITTQDGGGTTSSSGGTSVTISGGSASGNSTDDMTGDLSMSVDVSGIASEPMQTKTSTPSPDVTSGTTWDNYISRLPYVGITYLTVGGSKAEITVTDGGAGTQTVEQTVSNTSGPQPYGMADDSHWHSFSHQHSLPNHSHGVAQSNHKHSLYDEEGNRGEFHTHSLPLRELRHSHNINHYHTVDVSGSASGGRHTHTFSIPDHTHTISAHNHNLPNLSHTHNITLNSHSHDIMPGIFESGNATAFDIYVNGTKKTTISAKTYEGDITSWLLNAQNQVPRDSWIKVEIRPNDLAYVVSSVFVQGFVQSRGGGNY